ncbi:MAG: hypothetical protein ACRD0U_06965 [Acidimicrobiales bacterium]
MILAELEVFHSRPFTPTRRVALGRRNLPVDPAPGFGGILLGGIAAVAADHIDPELWPDLHRLTLELEAGQRVVQPRLRNRFQVDHIGLARTRALLRGRGERLDFDFDGHGSALQMTLAAAYAGGQLAPAARPPVFDAIRTGLRWRGDIGPELITVLAGRAGTPAWSMSALVDPLGWALDVLGLDAEGKAPGRREIQRRFRARLREAHPDHGAEATGAAQRIAELAEARRILLDS